MVGADDGEGSFLLCEFLAPPSEANRIQVVVERGEQMLSVTCSQSTIFDTYYIYKNTARDNSFLARIVMNVLPWYFPLH